MKFILPSLLGMLILVQSCTGQNPAPIKNSTHARRAVKGSCSSISLEGQVLSKKNILNIFDCSGWAKEYPELNKTILNIEEESFNRTFSVFNEVFFSTETQRKAFYNLIADTEQNGELNSLSYILEKSLSDHEVLSQLDKLLNTHSLKNKTKSNIFKMTSRSNDQNLKFVRLLKNLLVSFEFSKPVLSETLSEKMKSDLPRKVEKIISEISSNMDAQAWKHLSGVLYSEDSPIQNWATEGSSGNLRILLDIIEDPNFTPDIAFLEKSLKTGVRCGNLASSESFKIDVGQELKHKIEGLKSGTKESFEDLLLHGLSKYVAFQEFCEERSAKQGLKSFFNVLKYAFNVLPSSHDYNFLKRIHQVFGEDRFVFLTFISSQSFSALQDLLIELDSKGSDEQFVRSLYDVIAGLQLEDFKEASNLATEISEPGSQSDLWLRSWSDSWKEFSSVEKLNFINFLGVFLKDDVKSSDVFKILERVLITYPDLSLKLFKKTEGESFQSDLSHIVNKLSSANSQKELSSFLSNKGIFEFVSIMTQESNTQKKKINTLESSMRIHSTYVASTEGIQINETRVCFSEMAKTYEIDSSYYNLVNTLPESCLRVLGNAGFVGQIYLWMNASNNYFREEYSVDDFHSNAGVWSPGMLQFLFSTALKADLMIRDESGSHGILNNVEEIHRIVTHPHLLEMFHRFSELYVTINKSINLDSRFLNYVESHNDKDFNQIASDVLSITKSKAPYAIISATEISCQSLSSSYGVDPCHSTDELVSSSLRMLRVLKRKNENNNSLIKELIKLYHPQNGIELPFGKQKTRSHVATLDETIRFLYDLSSERTIKEFNYTSRDGKEFVKGSVIDRLEVVIRDISFNNNFYGAYFKNMVAGASNYRNDVSSSEKLLKALSHSSGVMRRVHALPKDSKIRLKNVRETFSSLIELSDEYVQPDGTVKTYDGLIQGLLAAVAESSALKTQSFNPYRFPDEQIVDGHNGEFLTEVVKMSGLRHLANFVQSHFDSKLSALNNPGFKRIDKNMISRFDSALIQNEVQLFLDKYLDNDRNQLNIFISDVVNFMKSLNAAEQKELEESLLEAMLLLSDESLSNANITELIKISESVLQAWPEMRLILLSIDSKSDILHMINQLMDGLVKNPKSLNSLLNTVRSSNLFNAQDIKVLSQNEGFRLQATDFINQLCKTSHLSSTLNWSETFELMFAAPNMKWGPVTNWLSVALGSKDNKLTISLLVSFLGEKQDNRYRLKGVMDELFLFHRDQLNQFLSETFKSLSLNSD